MKTRRPALDVAFDLRPRTRWGRLQSRVLYALLDGSGEANVLIAAVTTSRKGQRSPLASTPPLPGRNEEPRLSGAKDYPGRIKMKMFASDGANRGCIEATPNLVVEKTQSKFVVAVAGTVLPRAGLRWWRIGRALALSAPQVTWPRLSQTGGALFLRHARNNPPRSGRIHGGYGADGFLPPSPPAEKATARQDQAALVPRGGCVPTPSLVHFPSQRAGAVRWHF